MTDIAANILGLLLAAGQGQRFGSNKLLHPVRGQSLVSFALHAILASKLGDVRVVVGPGQDPVRSTLCSLYPDEARLTFVQNPKPELGMMSSLQTGLRALPPAVDGVTTDGVMLFLGDMPSVTPAIIDRLLASFEKGRIIIPTCGERLTHPRILPKEIFEEFLALAPNQSGQVVLKRHPERILRVPFEDESWFRDVDRPGDLP